MNKIVISIPRKKKSMKLLAGFDSSRIMNSYSSMYPS
jgi:hypothetical protein